MAGYIIHYTVMKVHCQLKTMETEMSTAPVPCTCRAVREWPWLGLTYLLITSVAVLLLLLLLRVLQRIRVRNHLNVVCVQMEVRSVARWRYMNTTRLVQQLLMTWKTCVTVTSRVVAMTTTLITITTVIITITTLAPDNAILRWLMANEHFI